MAAILPPPPTTFSAYFGDASKDPHAGNYAALLSPFDIDGPGPNATPDAVRQLIAAAAHQRQLLMVIVLVNGQIRPYFLPFRRDQAVGAAANPALDGKFFAYDGELVHGQGVLVELPHNLFNLTAQVQVPAIAQIQAHLVVHPDADTTMGPFAVGDPDTTTIRTRSLVMVPHKYAGLFLSLPDGIPPRYYFEMILPVIEADGLAADCLPLTRFFQLAITGQAAGGWSSLDSPCPVPPVRNHALLSQAHGQLATFIQSSPGGHNINLQPLVDTIATYQQHRLEQQDQVRQDKLLRESTTVAAWLGPDTFARLLRYSHVASEEHLAPVWSQLAHAKDKDRIAILQSKVRGELLSMDSVYVAEGFTVSLTLLTHLVMLDWAMLSDALETGCLGNAFLFTDSDVEKQQDINKQLHLVQSGGANPSLSDAAAILKTKIKLPGADESLRCVLRLCAVYRAVLPLGHPVTAALWRHYTTLRSFDPGWSLHATSIPSQRALKGVYHLQWLSVRLSNYFRDHDRQNDAVPCPNLLGLIDKIQLQEKWEPVLSPTFWD